VAIVDVGSGVSVAVFDSFLLMADLSSSLRPQTSVLQKWRDIALVVWDRV